MEKLFLQFCLCLLLSLTGVGCASHRVMDGCEPAKDPYLSVSLAAILAHPSEYDGKMVQLSGYYQGTHEQEVLYLAQEDARTMNIDNCIWLSAPKKSANRNIAPLRKGQGFVCVRGKFRHSPQGTGHMGAFIGELEELVYFREIKPEGKITRKGRKNLAP